MVFNSRIEDIPNVSPTFLVKNPTILMFWIYFQNVNKVMEQRWDHLLWPSGALLVAFGGYLWFENCSDFFMEGCFGYVKEFRPIVVVNPPR